MSGLKTLISGPPKPKPTVLPPVKMPAAPDDEDIRRARQRETAAASQRGGRMSTILTGEDKLGG
jgi:hypothetical protein